MSDGVQLSGVAADPNMPKIGQRVVGRYDVVRLLGQGGFAAVYEAIDTRASGRVAIKILHAEKSFDESFAKRFRQEVMLVRQLQHPNTIKITDAGTTETGCLFMVMEFVTGKELQKILGESGPMPPERVMHIGEQVLKALAEAHEKGIVHRDLKPQNIMIGRVGGEDDYVKVLDFGIAKALEPDMQQVQTQAGMVFCTPKYAAPEILMARGVKPAADVYALGLIMAEMLAGKPIIDAGSEAEAIARQLSPEPIALPPNVASSPLGQVLARALAKSLQERYRNAQEMLADLRAAKQPAITPSGFPSQSYGAAEQVPGAQTLRYDVPSAGAEAVPAIQTSRTGLVLVLLFLGMAILGAGAFIIVKMGPTGGTGPSTDVGGQVAVAEPEETDVGEEEPEVAGPWMGMVTQPFTGAAQETATPSAAIAQLRLLDASGQLAQLAISMLQQALLGAQIPIEFRDEATSDYLQLVENLVTVMTELDLCQGAARRLDRAFGAAALVAADAAPRISNMRSQIRDCRERVEEARPEWNGREYQRLLSEANEIYETAQALPEELADRPPRVFQSLELYQQALAMLLRAFDDDEIRRSQREQASRDLHVIYQNTVYCQLELELRLSAEATLEAMLDHVDLLPEESVGQVQELQLILADENVRAAAEAGIGRALEANASWDWTLYREVVDLAGRSHSFTRGAAPTPDEEPEEGGEEGETEAG